MNHFPLISAITLLPLLAGLLVLVGCRKQTQARWLALLGSGVTLAFAALLWARFNPALAGLQFPEKHPWVASLDIHYYVGVDGLSVILVLLTALVVPFAMLATPKLPSERPQLYYALLLFLQTGLFGTFTAFNFFHWFIYWELSLVPAFFLVRLWGGPGRNAAALQFFIYTMVGSIAMLLAFLAIFHATGTFDFMRLSDFGRSGELRERLAQRLQWPGLSAGQVSMLVFGGVLLGFAVKVPMFPLHTWLPATYSEAPTTTAMVLTGVMSKMGVYGFLRLLVPLFPSEIQAMLQPLLWLAVATIVLSAFAAVRQTDLKRMLAYSSINHLGYCLLGIFAVLQVTGNDSRWAIERASALNGVFLQMFNHGLTAALLFCFISFLERRTEGRRGLDDFGGLRKVAPVFCGLMGIAVFSSLGLPGLNGFVSEFLIFKGAFPLAMWATGLATLGLLATAVFLLTFMQRVFHGPLNEQWSGFPDLTWAERATVLPATLVMFALGIWPQLVIGVTNPTVVAMVAQLP